MSGVAPVPTPSSEVTKQDSMFHMAEAGGLPGDSASEVAEELSTGEEVVAEDDEQPEQEQGLDDEPAAAEVTTAPSAVGPQTATGIGQGAPSVETSAQVSSTGLGDDPAAKQASATEETKATGAAATAATATNGVSKGSSVKPGASGLPPPIQQPIVRQHTRVVAVPHCGLGHTAPASHFVMADGHGTGTVMASQTSTLQLCWDESALHLERSFLSDVSIVGSVTSGCTARELLDSDDRLMLLFSAGNGAPWLAVTPPI